MKRIITLILLSSILFTGCSFIKAPINTSGQLSAETPTLAPAEQIPVATPTATPKPVYNYETYYVINCEESISMYASADINSPELCKIPLGTGISYIKTAENGFCNISYQGLNGYALAANLSAQPPKIEEKEYVTYYVVNCNSSITLREAPDTKAAAIRDIPLGASVSYISTADNGFYKISYMGKTGYALASYLSQDPDAHSTVQENYYDPNVSYTTCYVVNCKESISLRTSPSTSANKYCEIPWGSAISYVGTASNGFYKVIYNGKVGYALASYISFSNPRNYNSGTYLRVVNCNVSITLRTAPSTQAAEICQIPLGSYVKYVSVSSNGFYMVTYNGRVGYALASYLR